MPKSLTLIIAFSLFSVLGFAQKGNYHEMTLEELMKVDITTASAVKEKLVESPNTVYVITAQDIEDRGYMTLVDVLEDIPEVEIQDKSHSERYNFISIRGIPGQENFIILQDGVRITSMAATRQAIDISYNVKNAEKIEIVLGPASVVYGADAFSGVINIITKKGDALQGASVTTSYGRFNTMQHAISAGGGNEKLSVAFHGSYYNSDEPNMAKFYPNDYRWYNEQYSVNGNMQGSLFSRDTIPVSQTEGGKIKDYSAPKTGYSFNTSLKFKDMEFGASRNSITYSTSNGVKPEYTIYSADNVWENSVTNIYMRYNWESTDKKFTLEPLVQGTFYELGTQSKFENVFSNYQSAYKYGFNNGYQATLNGSWTLSEQHRFSGGILFKYIDALPKTSDLPKEYNTTVSSAAQGLYYIGTERNDTSGRFLGIPQNFYQYTEKTIGGFAQYQTNYKSLLYLTVASRVDYNTRYGWNVNPRVSISYHPTAAIRVRASYNEAFIAPSPEQAYDHFGSFLFNQSTNSLYSFFWRVPNPDLKPVKLRAGELNASYLKGDFQFSLGGYYNSLTNQIIAVDAGAGTFLGVNISDREQNQNVGSSKAWGVTTKLDYRHTFGHDEKAVALSFYGVYTYSGGKSGDEDEVYFTAPQTVKAGLVLKWRGLTIDPRLIYRSGTYKSHATGAVEYQSPAFALLNLFLSYRIVAPAANTHSSLDVFVRVRNLLDARYYNTTYGNIDHFNGTPQDPMRFMIGLNYTFSKARK